MHLINDEWLPVVCKDGCHCRISPKQLGNPNISAFAANRADFNGALFQFAVGLLQTTTPVDDPIAWRQFLETPPDDKTLGEWLSSVESAAFNLDGPGSRFMQDFNLRQGDGTRSDISDLLIESPGNQTIDDNGDFFIKRGRVENMCPHCAAAALITLQINAPSGGAGYRTGLRGGGPLTTMLLSQPPRSLWHDLWLNVRERSGFLSIQGDLQKTEPHARFPWLANIDLTQAHKDAETTPAQVHPDHVFWAMPCRIRLNLDELASGVCDVCGMASDSLIQSYETKNYGLNYKGAWNHPFSPYYESKEGWLALHPQPGGFGYRHWLPWVLGMNADKKTKVKPAEVIEHFIERGGDPSSKGSVRIWAFGFDMDNAKARCWYESTLPLYGVLECDSDAQKQIESEVALWLAGADLAAFCLRSAVKDAWFGANARGDLSNVSASFWAATESVFYQHLKSLIDLAREDKIDETDPLPMREAWLRHLTCACKDLFNEFASSGAVERQKPQRIAVAYKLLVRTLDGSKIRKSLLMPVHAKEKDSK